MGVVMVLVVLIIFINLLLYFSGKKVQEGIISK